MVAGITGYRSTNYNVNTQLDLGDVISKIWRKLRDALGSGVDENSKMSSVGSSLISISEDSDHSTKSNVSESDAHYFLDDDLVLVNDDLE